jgi:Leucine-rich repeat (LRR) protein
VLAHFIKLDTLALNDTDVTDVSALTGLTDMVELYLHHNQIVDISALENLRELSRSLYLNNNQIKDIPPPCFQRRNQQRRICLPSLQSPERDFNHHPHSGP